MNPLEDNNDIASKVKLGAFKLGSRLDLFIKKELEQLMMMFFKFCFLM